MLTENSPIGLAINWRSLIVTCRLEFGSEAENGVV
jgi:hypothetical protein